MTALPAPLADLAIVARARSKASEYYAPLLEHTDELVRVGAWCALLEREEVHEDQFARVIELSRYGAVQMRAFRFFEGNWDHDLAAAATNVAAANASDAEALARRAELACDDTAAAEAQRQLYLATGRPDVLLALVARTEQAAGWRAALPSAVQSLMLMPHEPLAADQLLRLLHDARQKELLRAALDTLRQAGLHPYVLMLYEAAAKLLEGDAAACRKLLGSLDAARAPRPDILARARTLALRLNAEAFEKLGEYRNAYAAYVELNKLDQTSPASDDYYRIVRATAAQPIPPLPPDPLTNHFTMTGFPRSGTTLLENALAAHPRVETFEEIPALSSMQLHLDRALPRARDESARVAAALEGRRRYYDEEIRRHRKPGADIFIDKMPMRSAEAGLMLKMFPDKRYIFSIRHPYDVVLSCFKQQFSRNIAMEQFRTFEGAVKLYDFAMGQWFGVHDMTDPKVHYLRYDDLVTDFEASMRGVLGFLGAEWDPAVLGFAELADTRFARTPSYQKVRQGLSIGVQSSWRQYGFLFQSPAATPLAKWVEFFGYSTRADVT